MEHGDEHYPKVIIWDLDGTIWEPEMYQLWGGGAPFARPHADHLGVHDRAGQEIVVLGHARQILAHHRRALGHVRHAIASTCDEPAWAHECLRKIRVDERHERESALHLHFDPDLVEIYKAYSKETHFKAIAKKSGVALKDMIFFDNQVRDAKRNERLITHGRAQ